MAADFRLCMVLAFENRKTAIFESRKFTLCFNMYVCMYMYTFKSDKREEGVGGKVKLIGIVTVTKK